MTAGYSGTPLVRKLGIKAGASVGLVGAPEGFEATLGALPEGVRCRRDPSGGKREYDVIVLFARDVDRLRRAFARAAGRILPAGGLWVAWPKQSSPLAGEIKEGDVRRIGLEAGLVDNKICAIDEDWSGLRFVYRVEDRGTLGARDRIAIHVPAGDTKREDSEPEGGPGPRA